MNNTKEVLQEGLRFMFNDEINSSSVSVNIDASTDPNSVLLSCFHNQSKISKQQLGELGALLLCLAEDIDTSSISELLEGYGINKDGTTAFRKRLTSLRNEF